MDLLEDAQPRNTPEFTVSELSGAVKRLVEGEFSLVRVRGEVGRVSRPSSGHIYFDLKDDRAVLGAMVWKGQALRLTQKPEEGMEVIATGRLTTFPGQSKYQLEVQDLTLAGVGALMAMLERRRTKLAAEGLFDPARKRPLPYLPGVIGVVTSPSGAVIRDILHRLRDRFPRRVVLWPVAVQGEKCAPEVARAIAGFNALSADGPIPRPDVIIVARGGGSVEDLWGFNDEAVVRAAAASRIPLISAVGHETDTTLIDFAADVRAPTPTAAAELAVPVRADLIATVQALGARATAAQAQGLARRRQRVADLGRALPPLPRLLAQAGQRLDSVAGRLAPALLARVARARTGLARVSPNPALLRARLAEAGRQTGTLVARLARLGPRVIRDRAGFLAPVAARLTPDLMAVRLARLAERLAALDRLRQSLGYPATLARGYAVIRSEGRVITRAAQARGARGLEVEFADGRVALATAEPRRKTSREDPGQGSLL
jgi:exodeoxyribonuclease VII large subunit